MREIKFRAWDKNEKTMLDVWTICFKTKKLINGYWERKINKPNCDKCYGHALDEPLDKFILMQYTGLKDKNGKEICENDIIKCPYPKDVIANVEFSRGMFMLKSKGCCWIGDYLENQLEVIGNIWENPELLKG